MIAIWYFTPSLVTNLQSSRLFLTVDMTILIHNELDVILKTLTPLVVYLSKSVF